MEKIKNLWANTNKKTKVTLITAATMAVMLALVCCNMFFANSAINSLFSTAKGFLTTIYNGLNGIVSLLAVVICAWCFCIKMFSKNPRSIEEATQWMKRVIIAWLCFQLLGLFVNIGNSVVNDMKNSSGVNAANPWDA